MKGLHEQLSKPKARKVVLVRHGDTPMNGEEVVRGWTDTPLDRKGEKQADKLGKQLKDSGVDCIIVSDLLRTLQTARRISEESGIPIIATNPCLHTWNVGEYTGKPADEADPELELVAIEEPDKTIKGGESFNEFKHRYLLGLIALLNEYSDKTVAIVTHGRNLAILNAWRSAGYPDDLELDYDDLGYESFPPATAHVFEITSCYVC